MKKIVSFLFLLGAIFSACQQPAISTDVVESTVDQANEFPSDWLGQWKGTLVITKPSGDTSQIPMQLHILQNDSIKGWDWKIIYGEDVVKGTRAYSLYEKDAEKGHFVIDENNSIVLDGYVFGDTYYSRFSVAGSFLLATYRKKGNELWFEILSGKAKGQETGGKDDIPSVESFGINVRQRAVLTRPE